MRTGLLLLIVAAECLARLTLVESDSRGVRLRYEPGAIRLDSVPGGRVSIHLEDGERIARPGEWDLPVKVVRVGVPQHGGVRLAVACGAERETTGVRLTVMPHFSWENDSFWADEPAAPSDPSPAEVGGFEFFRSVRFVTLMIRPVQYDPTEARLRWFEWLEVGITYEREPHVVSGEDVADRWVEQLLVNGNVAKRWRMDLPARLEGSFGSSSNWVKLKVSKTGIQRLTGSELLAAGVPLAGVDPRTIALFSSGEHEPNVGYPDSLTPLPLFVLGGEDGRFDADDTLLFYGLRAEHWWNRCSTYVRNYFTDDNVYWLTWGTGVGRRLRRGLGPDTSGLPFVRAGRRIVREERDVDCPARSGLLWIWARILKPAAQPVASWEVFPDVARPLRLEKVVGRLFSESGNNTIGIHLNGRPIAQFQFGQSLPSSPFDFSVDTVLPLASYGNSLRFDLSGDGEKRVYVDYLELTYTCWLSLEGGQLHFLSDDTGRCRFVIRDVNSEPFLFDVTDPYNPIATDVVLFQGDSAVFAVRRGHRAEYCVAGRNQLLRPVICGWRKLGRLRDPTLQAEYWIVSPREFLPAAQELARYRTGNVAGIPSARVRVAALDEIYDDYCFGLEEPWAIKAFFADKRPMYGLLVGDATYDYRGRLGKGQSPGVPAYESGFGLDPDGARDRSALAVDAWYADFEGDGGSPDMALGRVTVRSGEEMRRFVRKVKEYEEGQAGNWTRRYLLLADDEFLGNPYEPRYWDPLGFQHIDMCENMRVIAGDVLDPVQVYSTEYPYAQVKSKPMANAELLRQLNAGCVLWVFFGHGQANDLTHESVLNIARLPDINNGGRIPFCYFGSCSVGRFEDTRYECIAEELVRMTGGAIATIGATKSTAAGSNLVFARNLTTPIFSSPGRTIGEYFLLAWPTDRTYHLFGDPATVLRIPVRSSQELVVQPDTLHAGGVFRCRSILEVPTAEFTWNLLGPRRYRSYSSVRGTKFYLLAGNTIARGSGKVREGRFYCEGMLPVALPLDTEFVHNGWYAPLERSCRLSAVVWNDSIEMSAIADTLTCSSEPAISADSSGPSVLLLCEGRYLYDGAVVPAKFQLEGVVTDPSGILIAPVPGFAPQLFVNHRRSAIDLTDMLVFDDSIYTTARFRIPVSLTGSVDSLCMLVADNRLNLTAMRVVVKPLYSGVVAIDSVLVFPNPVSRSALFTFVLARTASVYLRIYSLSGRLLRTLGPVLVSAGPGGIPWDGRDRDGRFLPNGVYLFVLSASVTDEAGGSQLVAVRDRFLVVR